MEARGEGEGACPATGPPGPRNRAWALPHLFHFHCYRPSGKREAGRNRLLPRPLRDRQPGRGQVPGRPSDPTAERESGPPEMGLRSRVQYPTLRITQQIPLLQEDPPIPPPKKENQKGKKIHFTESHPAVNMSSRESPIPTPRPRSLGGVKTGFGRRVTGEVLSSTAGRQMQQKTPGVWGVRAGEGVELPGASE